MPSILAFDGIHSLHVRGARVLAPELMKNSSHIAKFRRLDAALSKLDAEDDSELWIWTAMNACVNLLNAALHHAELTHESDLFHTQVEGVYARPNRTAGTLTDVAASPGDVMHAGQPALSTPLPASLQTASLALASIEDLREGFVRGSEVPTRLMTEQWQRAYRSCRAELCRMLNVGIES